MKKELKQEVISALVERLSANRNFYLVDSSDLNAAQVSNLRRECFKEGVKLQVIKNTLVDQALQQVGITEDFSSALKGSSSLMYCDDNALLPATLIKNFRKKNPKPLLKAAFIEDCLYLGDENLDTVTKIKSKQVLLGEILATLQSPMQNVISGLKGQGSKIAGILKTLSEKEG